MGHVTVECRCGATGVRCRAHRRVDWGEERAMTCAQVRRALAAAEDTAADDARRADADVRMMRENIQRLSAADRRIMEEPADAK